MPDTARSEKQADAALVAALVEAVSGEQGVSPDLLSPEELADQTGIPVALLEAMEREQLLVARHHRDGPRYTTEDAEALRAGLALLEAGVPLDELLDLARRHDGAMRGIAAEAVDMFVRFVRDPIKGAAESEVEASQRLVTAFTRMLPATRTVVSHHFARLLLAEAQARIPRDVEGDGPGQASPPTLKQSG